MKMTMKVTNETSLKNGFKEFLQWKSASNLSKASLQNYENNFRYFTDFIGEDEKCSNINENTIFDYISHLRKTRPDIRDITLNTYIRSIRVILNCFMEKGYTSQFKIKLVRAEKTIKETYTDAELELLLKKPDIKKCSFAEYRNWVIICYLMGTGNRTRTFCNVKISDIDFINHEIRLKAVKNKKQYIIPLSPALKKTLHEYLSFRKGKPDDYLFCTAHGTQITSEGIKTIIQRYNNSRGVSKTSIHLFRHTFAKKWILNGGDIFRLQKILGHSSLEIVKEYVNMYGTDLQKNFEMFNPLDNIPNMKHNSSTIRMD